MYHFSIKNLPGDHVSYWDFDDPDKKVRDSSAAAIASSALLDLSALSGKEEFWQVAINILSSLFNNYLSEENEDGILKHGCFHKSKNIGVNERLYMGGLLFYRRDNEKIIQRLLG